MQTLEQDPESRASISSTAPDRQQVSGPNPGEGTEPELNSLSSRSLAALWPTASHNEPAFKHKKLALEDMFVTRQWHRAYAEALIESDPAKLPRLIAEAEEAILNRYLEIVASGMSEEESGDLRHAVEALNQLKKSN